MMEERRVRLCMSQTNLNFSIPFWSHQIYFMLASIRGSSSLLITFSTFLISSRPPLSACPSPYRSYATEFWIHTENVEVKATLIQDPFKKYKPVLPDIRHLHRPLSTCMRANQYGARMGAELSWPHHARWAGDVCRD